MTQSKAKDDESMISEESYLKDESQPSPKASKAPIVIRKPIVTNNVGTGFKPKSERVRDNIEDDYENDGFEDYSGSLKADKLRQQEAQAAKQ